MASRSPLSGSTRTRCRQHRLPIKGRLRTRDLHRQCTEQTGVCAGSLAAAGVEFDDEKMPNLAGMEGLASSAWPQREFWFHLGRFCG